MWLDNLCVCDTIMRIIQEAREQHDDAMIKEHTLAIEHARDNSDGSMLYFINVC